MKYIVIGLGYFGGTLATTLTRMGNEVIGIDNREEKVDEFKDSISIVMMMDTTNINAVRTLPLQDVDAVIVAIGEDIGSSVLTLSILKNLNVERIIGRAITPIHLNILEQIGIKETIQPEEDSALKVSSMLQIENAKSVLELNEEYVVTEVIVPSKYIGHTLQSVDILGRFNVKTIAIKTPPKEKVIDVFYRRDFKVDFDVTLDRILHENEIMVLAGKTNDIKDFIKS